ncbi:DEAD/DEAH box helicase [Candidatus Woesearchaeota archaeon]|nr:DEAD/DEAH box helicase [Candidatus Woesearchaeota archaeon]
MSVDLFIKGHDLCISPSSEPSKQEIENTGFVVKQEFKGKTYYKTMPINFHKLLHLKPNILFSADKLWSASIMPELKTAPRDYQTEAFDKWRQNDHRGVIVLPTGTGKTMQALMAINELRCSTLIVVPTIDLLHQWKTSIQENLGVEAGILGGGFKEISPVTVTTYDSAAIHIRRLNMFKLVVFDEVHHLPTEANRMIAEGLVAPYRLGLSATPERLDELHKELPSLVGDIVYRKSHSELKDYLADFRLERIDIDLSEQELGEYEESMKTYRSYIFRKKMYLYGKNAYQHLIYRVGTDKEARKALLSHQEARKIALNASRKLDMVSKLLRVHQDDKVILFSEFNSVVDSISRMFLIPSITYKTPRNERKEILEDFRNGKLTKIVTGRVLDEGVDVPDASVGIIVSGSGSERAYIQRLGRIIRPKEGKEALLYELVTKKTLEMRKSYERKKGVR